METANLNSEEIALLAELARELAPDLPRIAREWAARSSDDSSRLTSLSDGAALAQRLFAAIVAGNVEAAMEICVAQARAIAERRASDRDRASESLDDLFAGLAVARSTLEAEIIRRTAANSERRLKALLGFTRLWTRMAERFAATYVSALEANKRRPHTSTTEPADWRATLAARLAHEIRTPLNVILGYADLMAERLHELDDPTGASHGASIKRAGKRLLRMISAVLELSKANGGVYDLKPMPLNLGAFARREVEQLAVLARRKNIQLSCIVEEPAAVVRFDERCLSGALVNLIQNAIKFTVEGGVTVRVFRDGTGELRLEIRDTGAGIDPAYLPRLFEPFTRENSAATRAVEGSGLGLALARRYVELNGARILVRSEKNVGSRFIIVFAGTEARPRASDFGAI